MGQSYRLINGDNKGYAAFLLEQEQGEQLEFASNLPNLPLIYLSFTAHLPLIYRSFTSHLPLIYPI